MEQVYDKTLINMSKFPTRGEVWRLTNHGQPTSELNKIFNKAYTRVSETTKVKKLTLLRLCHFQVTNYLPVLNYNRKRYNYLAIHIP